MDVWQVIVTDGSDFDAVRYDALYQSESRAKHAAAVEVARAQLRYRDDDMADVFMRQISAKIIRRRVI